MQNTVAKPTIISGVSMHSGQQVTMKLIPSNENSGIVFRDKNGHYIQARFDNVHSTNMSTKLSDGQCSVDLVEHLMAGLWGIGIDNLIVELDSIEVPICDGSAKVFLDEIIKVGIQRQNVPRKIFTVTEEIKVTDNDKYVIISPNNDGLIIDMTIDFTHNVIGRQQFIFDSTKHSFADDIAPARTFGFIKDLDQLHQNGLALGASLDNCIGLIDDSVANTLRFKDEFVRHKILDCIGDLFLSGYYLHCKVVAYKTGHKLNNIALRRLFQ
jgi:UDP-3-O-[3-hydroxymyristoyl] N-acetylglucosamine deacetylase